MFPGDRGTKLEANYLRSGRIFRSRKRRKTIIGRGICSTTRGEYYEIASHLDEGSCDEEEEYKPISEGEDESKKSSKTPIPEH